MANNNSETERRLWSAADELLANSELKSSEYAKLVLGLIFFHTIGVAVFQFFCQVPR
jgi:type I restriction-modification system DNA methylase subunit